MDALSVRYTELHVRKAKKRVKSLISNGFSPVARGLHKGDVNDEY
jgi:hypothetical protein